jgi:hypothetical protein
VESTESGTAGAGLGPWTKVILWSLVFVFGVLYLSSGKRSLQTQSPTTVGVTAEALHSSEPPGSDATPGPGVPVADVGGGTGPAVVGEAVSDHGAKSPPNASPSEGTSAGKDTPEPLRAAESAAFADSLLAREPPEGRGEAAGDRMRTSANAPPEAGVGVAPQVPPAPASAGPGAPTELRAEPAVPETSLAPTSQAPRATAASGPGEEAGSAASVDDPLEAQRARILTEYEAMRRAAEEEMRRRWQRMGVPAPGRMPYGPPGYGPGPWGYPGH